MIGELAGEAVATDELIRRTSEMFAKDPCGGTTAYSSRIRCVTSVAVFMARCQPDDRWALEAVELSLDHSRADLVWRNTEGSVVFDEVKSGRVILEDFPDVKDQLERLSKDGVTRFGERFQGVRLVPLGCPGRMALYKFIDGRLCGAESPEGMCLR